jgi:hypothetical protein
LCGKQGQPTEELAEDQVEQAPRHDHGRAGARGYADRRRSRPQADFWNPTGVVIRPDRAAGDRLRWYRVVYAAAYLLRLVVWQRPTPPSGLVALVEGGAGAAVPEPLPAGRALELGAVPASTRSTSPHAVGT